MSCERPCKNCPFRREGFIVLNAEDADALVDFVGGAATLTICHKTQGMDYSAEKPCRGANLFKAQTNDPEIFATREEMVAAHRSAPLGRLATLHGIYDEDEIL